MSYDNSANSVRRLEERFERLLLILGDMQAAIGRLQQPSYNSGGGQPGGGGGGVFVVQVPTAGIAAGSNLGGQTISIVSGGSLVQISTNALIYNEMAVPTVATKPLICGLNND